jgi:VWFA-related protein
MRRIGHRLLGVAALLLAPAVAPARQQPEPARQPTASAGDSDLEIFGESVDVEVVNVDVHVTGPDGRPLKGLTAADFEILEDGRPVEISNFYVVEDGRRTDLDAEARAADASSRPTAPRTRDEAAPVREEERLHLVVFIDNWDLRALERNRVLDDVTTFLLRTLRREDRVMLATFGGSFKVLHPFTSDPFAIDRELDALRDTTAHVQQRDNLRREAIKDIDRARNAQEALASARVYSDMVRNELEFMFGGLRELIDHLAGLPGRKAVLHVSSGIPMLVGEELFYAIERKFDDSSAMSYAPQYDLSRRFEEVGRRANANRVSFFMLDAGGLRPPGAGVDEQGLRTPGLATSLSSDYEANQHSPLRFLAAETGGAAIVNQNNVLPALTEVREALRSFYSLGFRPSGAGDEGYHRIKVKVPGRNVKVEHRTGYQHKTIDTNMRERTLAALYHFYEENPLGLEVGLQDTLPREASTFLVTLRLEIPVARITLLPVAGAREARLRLYLAVMDGEGRVSEVQRSPLGLRLKEENVAAALAERFVHAHRLVTRGGRQKIAIGLRDELSGESTFLARTLQIGGNG